MRSAHFCDDLERLLEVARTRNAEYLPPLPETEVLKIAKSDSGLHRAGREPHRPNRGVVSDKRGEQPYRRRSGCLYLAGIPQGQQRPEQCLHRGERAC